jgi:hypothetical protein
MHVYNGNVHETHFHAFRQKIYTVTCKSGVDEKNFHAFRQYKHEQCSSVCLRCLSRLHWSAHCWCAQGKLIRRVAVCMTMLLCMCVCVYMCMRKESWSVTWLYVWQCCYICVYVCICVCARKADPSRGCMYDNMQLYIYMCVYTYIHIYIYIYMYVCMYVYVYIYIYIYIYIHVQGKWKRGCMYDKVVTYMFAYMTKLFDTC